jgi:hypothetical protein
MTSDAELHARRAHPDFEYRTTTGPRKQWDEQNTPPVDADGNPDPTWERNVDAGRDGWERFDYTEESYWRRRKRTAHPCARPECGGEVHTDPWGTPVQCPHRRCPRCDCADGHTQCEHCKICTHAEPAAALTVPADATSSWAVAEPAAPTIAILGEDGRTPLVTIHPNGTLEYGPDYTPDEAARAFWDALAGHYPARCPNCGHSGTETP